MSLTISPTLLFSVFEYSSKCQMQSAKIVKNDKANTCNISSLLFLNGSRLGFRKNLWSRFRYVVTLSRVSEGSEVDFLEKGYFHPFPPACVTFVPFHLHYHVVNPRFYWGGWHSQLWTAAACSLLHWFAVFCIGLQFSVLVCSFWCLLSLIV